MASKGSFDQNVKSYKISKREECFFKQEKKLISLLPQQNQ